jgi:hypothetical protein
MNVIKNRLIKKLAAGKFRKTYFMNLGRIPRQRWVDEIGEEELNAFDERADQFFEENENLDVYSEMINDRRVMVKIKR